MVSTTRAEPPGVTTDATLPFRQLSRAAPVAVAVAGCVLSGLITSTFYALVPAWMQDEGIARETIAMSMLVAVFGGLAFQVPVGRLSDRFDRRLVLAALGLGFAGTAVTLVLLLGGGSAGRGCSAALCRPCTRSASQTPRPYAGR